MKTTLLIAAGVAAGFLLPLVPSAVAHADEVCATYPFKVVAVGSTSCPFALNVRDAMGRGGHGADGETFTVYSPVTGESYEMHCMVEGHGSTTCRGGDDAAVILY
jgi:hypothetical protein